MPFELTLFFSSVKNNEHIKVFHVALYMALVAAWSRNQFNNPFYITRREIMQEARIHALATYHKCMKDLIRLGYITYLPSYHPAHGSQVEINKITL